MGNACHNIMERGGGADGLIRSRVARAIVQSVVRVSHSHRRADVTARPLQFKYILVLR